MLITIFFYFFFYFVLALFHFSNQKYKYMNLLYFLLLKSFHKLKINLTHLKC